MRPSKNKGEQVFQTMQDRWRLWEIASPGTMKMLCLNCQGLGQPEAVREVRSLCELHRPWVVFLLKTRFYDGRVDGLVHSLGLEGGFGVGSYGRGGGLALLWSREV